MATTISRTWYDTLQDDSGSGTDGSIWDKADVDAMLDAIDAMLADGSISFGGALAIVGALSGVTSLSMSGALTGATTGTFSGALTAATLAGGAIEQTTTSTGSQNDFALTTGASVLRCNNASLLTLTGLAAGRNGQLLDIVSVGAGQVDFADESVGSTAANRIISGVAATISLAPGVGRLSLRYDSTSLRWRVLHHEQGAMIAFTPTWTAVSVNPSIGDGTIFGYYYLRGKKCWIDVVVLMGSTTTFGTGAWMLSLPYAGKALDTGVPPSGLLSAFAFDSGTNYRLGMGMLSSTTALRSIFDSAADNTGPAVPFTWANGDALRITGEYLVG